MNYENYDKIFIYTNGTIVFKDEKMKVFKNDKILFKISNYGKVEVGNVDRLEASLNNLNIKFITGKVKTWQIAQKSKNMKEMKNLQIYVLEIAVKIKVLTLLRGKLYMSIAANATNLGAI